MPQAVRGVRSIAVTCCSLLLTLLPWSIAGPVSRLLCLKNCSSAGSPRLSEYIHLLWCESTPWAVCGYLLWHGPLHGLQGTSAPDARAGFFPSFFSDLAYLHCSFSHFFPLISSALKLFSQRHNQLCFRESAVFCCEAVGAHTVQHEAAPGLSPRRTLPPKPCCLYPLQSSVALL